MDTAVDLIFFKNICTKENVIEISVALAETTPWGSKRFKLPWGNLEICAAYCFILKKRGVIFLSSKTIGVLESLASRGSCFCCP